jgi:membrane protease YdiL (CAAX protease family)
MLVSPLLGESAARALSSRAVAAERSIRNDGIHAALIYAGSAAVGAFLIYLLVPRAGAQSGLRARWSDIPVGLGAILLALPVVQVVSVISVYVWTLVTHETPEDVAHSTLREILGHRADPWIWLVIVGAVIGAPVQEELTFRVFFSSALRRRASLTWPAIIVSAALFALMHRMHGPDEAPPVAWYAIPTLFVLGVSFGVAYERTGRLLVPMVMHAAYNGANIVLAMTFL